MPIAKISLERLGKRGYQSMVDYYSKINPQLNEPLYTRSVRIVVRGAPHRPQAVRPPTRLAVRCYFYIFFICSAKSISGFHFGDISSLKQEPKAKSNFINSDRTITGRYNCFLHLRENNDSKLTHQQ